MSLVVIKQFFISGIKPLLFLYSCVTTSVCIVISFDGGPCRIEMSFIVHEQINLIASNNLVFAMQKIPTKGT